MGILLLIVLLTAPLEILIFEILIPWTWLRILILLASVYSILWILALYASLTVVPHRLKPDMAVFHHGALAEGRIPYTLIDSIAVDRRASPGGQEGIKLSPDKTSAYLAVGGKTDVTLRLREPREIYGLIGTTAPVSTLCVAVNESERMVQALGKRIGTERDMLSAAGAV
jgi:hypothetical protein